MTAPTPTEIDPAEAARVLQRYSKQYSAGAFATPTRRELEENPQRILCWDDGATVAYARPLTRNSTRRDWTGREFIIPAGATVITNVAHQPGAAVPPALFEGYSWVMVYAEDSDLNEAALVAGRGKVATRISASSELIAVWGPDSGDIWTESAIDKLGLASIPLDNVSDDLWAEVVAEATAVDEWADDFPFYSDGSWDAISLRGYRPDDPAWGVKPSEMGRGWHADNPEAASYSCDWTTFADRVPATLDLIQLAGFGDGHLDRVRFMRMDGGRGSDLRRHTDITDKQAGTRNGQMVRFFIPVLTDPSVTTTSWDLHGFPSSAHLGPKEMHYLDIRKPHAVNNPSGKPRVHLAIDAIVDDHVASILRELTITRIFS